MSSIITSCLKSEISELQIPNSGLILHKKSEAFTISAFSITADAVIASKTLCWLALLQLSENTYLQKILLH